MKRILIIGGYGNFGQFIAKVLAKEPEIQLIIAGRHLSKAQALSAQLEAAQPIETAYCDINNNFAETLKSINPHIVIHTSGPFQGQDYIVAEACLAHHCHYIDLADSRQFVEGISQLNEVAKEKQLLICTGASSVPGLSSAVINHHICQFSELQSVDYAIATAQLTNLGLATTKGVLTYAGKSFTTLINGKEESIYGWQNLRLKPFWQLKPRLLGNCDIPDLALFPTHYPQLKTIRFQAGLELKSLQLGLYALSWLVRIRLIPSLDHFASYLLKISHCFKRFGHNNTGFYMEMAGLDAKFQPKQLRFEIYAAQGDGLYIPCIPSILLAKKIVHEESYPTGALACVGLISLDEYLGALKELELSIHWRLTSKLNEERD